MSVSKIAFVLTAVASLAAADSAAETAELQAIIGDINSHLSDYLGLETGNSGFKIPADVLSVYQQVMTYTDDAYTTLFSELDYDAITKTIVKLPWYTTRLSSEIAAAVASVSPASSAAPSSAASSSSAAPSSSAASSSSAAPSSSAASSSSAAPSSSAASSSSAAPSSSAASSSSAAPSSSAASSSAVSTSSAAPSTSAASTTSSVSSTVETASNAGQRVNAGAASFGAIVAGAAALLL
ncbi:putative lipase SKDI_02G1730 [Saccharomyces kudriavzevii IFO 1802]|uniref:TIR1-like protein n=1 Tax=Saccharomyces kudriavzevii (strain ATCC MYA-4449 / AS 2.2408 / CBS 8840 / NBRC 1802 / NCYC 2889) TaxID=226230 RepID=A0AA35JCI4_SACK1|nr:uncharacterized protein SKDI_02G1730 [Saccharomyces kudriavzevii IFO 1802]CAI4055393.1 hypothetical protein SKDI_02G1730 [Saccharomyces kudriavzevii IFO 1802]